MIKFKSPLYLLSCALIAHTTGAGLKAKAADFSKEKMQMYSQVGAQAFGDGNYIEAEQVYKKALAEARLGEKQELNIASILTNLGVVLTELKKYEQAEEAFQESYKIKKKILGESSRSTIKTMKHYAYLLRKTRRFTQARQMEALIKLLESSR